MGGNQLLDLIGAGASLVVGTVSRDAEPRATRAWGSSVVATEPLRLRILMSADDPQAVANLQSGNISLTGATVHTLQSAQLKGTVVLVEPATPADLELVAMHTDVFFQAVLEVDGFPPTLMRRLLPLEVVAFEMLVTETFDQSPGPGAGAALDR